MSPTVSPTASPTSSPTDSPQGESDDTAYVEPNCETDNFIANNLPAQLSVWDQPHPGPYKLKTNAQSHCNPIGHADDDSDGKPNQVSHCKPNHDTDDRTNRDADCKPDNLDYCQSHHQPHHVTDGELDDVADG